MQCLWGQSGTGCSAGAMGGVRGVRGCVPENLEGMFAWERVGEAERTGLGQSS